MRLDIKEYDVILSKDGESIIGYSDNIIKLYKDYIKQLVDDIQDEAMIDDLRSEIAEILDLLHSVYETSEDWYEPQLIKVFYNPMGAYQFKTFKEEM